MSVFPSFGSGSEARPESRLGSHLHSNLTGRFLVLVCLICPMGIRAQQTCFAVTPSGAGSKNGSSWSNAFSASAFGSGMHRGAVYYLADGNYGNHLSLTTAASGTSTIELRKAQSYDFGRASDGCSSDISAGWNASTMGSSQAYWAS